MSTTQDSPAPSAALARRNGSSPGLHIPNDPIALGQVLAQSGFFQDSRGAAQAAVKVMAGQELGFGPVASMTGIYIVKGRVTLSANLMAAAIKRHPAYNYRVREHGPLACSVEFFEDGESCGTSTFTMEEAKAAGLAGSETYRKHPRNMLFARAMSNGAKWFCPDVFGGGPIYTPDELGAEIDGETGEVVGGVAAEELPPAQPAAEAAPAPRRLSERQRGIVVKAVEDAGQNLDLLLAAVGVASVEELTSAHATELRRLLDEGQS